MKNMKKLIFPLMVVVLLMPLLMGMTPATDSREIALKKPNMKSGWTLTGESASLSQTSRNFTDGAGNMVSVFVRVYSSDADAAEAWDEALIEGEITPGGRPAPLVTVDAYGMVEIYPDEEVQFYSLRRNVISMVEFDRGDYPLHVDTHLKCERAQILRIYTPGDSTKCPLTALP